ncbi:DUF928 domain-containing protein [Tolypothrix sp. FACHB-123]|uniref:DUF928 domain-containing protein n=1 Tax=Tolypothrix sp. FACHB-123 TaxID=2692868 RepID=UPI001F5496C5|nr:DUF928 domain-containing protein [Tolypothrix sp. FACHB-123]
MKNKVFIAICLTSVLTLACAASNQVLASENQPKEGLPGRRIGGGTRGECSSNAGRLMALVPQNNLALTQQAYPNILFHIPQTSKPTTIEFVLQDDSRKSVYEKTFTKDASNTKADAGEIINLRWLDAQFLPELAIDKKYHWYLSIICDPENRANDIVVHGWIKRVAVEPNLAKKIERASLVERAHIYAQAGLWQDALATLAELRYSQPQDSQLAASWTQLLNSEKLSAIAQEPLLNIKIHKKP